MGWLSPWILAGALLAAVPWWLHRRRRPAARATPFGSLMFVPAGPEPARRRRVRHRRLLALRLAALLLLTTAFARPYRLLEEGALQDAEAGCSSDIHCDRIWTVLINNLP